MIAGSPRPRAPRAIGAFASFGLMLGALFVLFAGCGLDPNGLQSEGPDASTDATDATGPACTSASQCDNGNVCQTAACSAGGVCTFTDVADGMTCRIGSGNTPGQCKAGKCTGVQCDTATDCAAMACQAAKCDAAGTCAYTPAADGMACTGSNGAAGLCKTGVCTVGCTSSSQCTPTSSCQTGTCSVATGTCVFSNVPDGTKAPGNVMGDCHAHVCMAGVDTTVVDDTNVPAAVNDCGTPTCTAGTPGQSFAQHPADSPCSTYMTSKPGFCDGMGHCDQCGKDSECPGTTTDCQHPSCASGSCSTTFATSGTVTMTNPPQVAGDCQQIECNGAGATMSVADNADTPAPLGGGCQPGLCTAGVPSHGTSSNGTACGTGLACLNGQCSGCTTNSQCQPPAYDTCGATMPNVCGCNQATCASLGATCGSPSDGCGGTLACNDSKTDGTETDVDCGGSTATCTTRCAQGKKCKVGPDCASGSCVDGVCCNTACGGTCQACSAAAKGQGADGVCGAVAAGPTNDPHHNCSVQSVSSCGESGGCNGAGACNTYPTGTKCTGQTCAAGTVTSADTCVGGVCTPPTPPTLSCAPYAVCSGTGCGTTCGADTDCVSGDYCTGAGGACVPKKTQGTACGGNHECQNGACVDGFCCSSATCHSGQCMACSAALTGGANGSCAPVLAGDADPSGTCPAQASTTCGTDGKCAGGATCQKWAAGTTCSNVAGCSGSTLTTDTQCDGNGNCAQGVTTAQCPNKLTCNAGMAACQASCAGNDANCVPGYYCNVGNTCAAQVATGPCSAPDQCTAPHICGTTGAGNCCAAACSTSDPTCGATDCDPGTGACLYPTGTGCGTSCNTSTSMLTTSTCNGSGACAAGTASPCAGNASCASPTACNGTNCGSNDSAGDARCATGYWCNGSACVAAQMVGGCTRNSQCTGSCVGLVCL